MRKAYHLYRLLYQKDKFAGLDRAVFLRVLKAEGIPAASGDTQLNKEPFRKNVLASRGVSLRQSGVN